MKNKSSAHPDQEVPMASILVIDDEADVRTPIAHILKSTGWEVFEARDGNQGMAQLRRHTISVVITDILMPEMDGIEVVIEMRKFHQDKKILAISKSHDLLRLASLLGAHAIMSKPLDPIELVKVVNRLISGEERGSTEIDDAGASEASMLPGTFVKALPRKPSLRRSILEMALVF